MTSPNTTPEPVEGLDEIVKVEISILLGEWQWMGKLTKQKLSELCKIADKLSDESTQAQLERLEGVK